MVLEITYISDNFELALAELDRFVGSGDLIWSGALVAEVDAEGEVFLKQLLCWRHLGNECQYARVLEEREVFQSDNLH